MKKLLLFFSVWFLFIFTDTHSYDKDFILGFEGGLPGPHNGNIPWDWYAELHCNFFQAWDNTTMDQFPGMPSQIQYSFFMPPYLHTRSWSQQTIYQAEQTDNSSNAVFKYKYNTHRCGSDITDNSQYGAGERVRYFDNIATCGDMESGGITVLEGIDEWFEQTGSIIWWRTDEKYSWQRTEGSDSLNIWYIKPKMRIDPTFAVNNPNENVVRVDIFPYGQNGGEPIRSVIIKCGNFLNQGVYNGSYIEEYFLLPPESNLQVLADNVTGLNKGRDYDDGPDPQSCGVDFKIHWYGTVDVWIDYVKVEDQYAYELFKGDRDQLLQEEMGDLINDPLNAKFTGVFTEEFQMNNLNSIKYINDKMAAWFPNDDRARVYSLLNDHTFDNVEINTQSRTWPYGKYLNKINPKHLIINNNYQFWRNQSWMQNYWLPPNVEVEDNLHDQMGISEIEYEQVRDVYEENTACSYAQYNNYLQGDVLQPWSDTCRRANDTTKLFGIDYWVVPQLHHWENANTQWMREPLNQEFEAVSCVALSNGAKGLIPYTYESLLRDETSPGSGVYKGTDFGMFDFGGTAPDPEDNHYNGRDIGSKKRIQNFYGQYKWDFVKSFYHKVKNWGPILANSHTTKGYSVHRDGANHEFINDIKSIYRDPSSPYEFDDLNEDGTKYWEMGFFYPDFLDANDKSKYFMMVNRRCVPEISGGDGDLRQLKIKFNSGSLPGFNNWKIIDFYSEQEVAVFDKNANQYINFGTFDPGEGRLYKLAPVMQEGGTFVTNEYVGAGVVCKGTVENDGYRLVIPGGSSVQFTPTGNIIMDGGSFFCGQHPSGGENGSVISGYQSGSWDGIDLIDCDTVKVYQSAISGIAYPGGGSPVYAFDISNCGTIDISYNQFTGISSGAINAYFTSAPSNPNIVIYANQFTITNNLGPMINFNANSSLSIPVIADGNQFVCTSSSNSMAIGINNISGGVIKNNEITNFNNGILASSSSVDLYNNTIISSLTGSSISAFSGSTLKLAPGMSRLNAGFNYIANSDDDANNIEVNNSLFVVHEGHNTFDISGSFDNGKHFSGYFPGSSDGAYSIDYNCYTHGEDKTDPEADVTWGYMGDPVIFSWGNDCESGESAGHSSKTENTYLVIPISDVYNDTIEIRTGELTGSPSDSLSLKMRERDYEKVFDIAKRILINSPDSSDSYDAVNKLYLASLRLDSAGNRITPLKTFLEDLIIENPGNAGLISRAFYFIQKCKAALGDYQSAMTGFEDIMNNNPNTYEALVASWDYSATALLLNGGNSGGTRNADLDELGKLDKLYELNSFSDDPDDRDRNSKGKREQIKINVIKSFEETRKEEISIVNKLKERSDRGDKSAGRELKRREALQSTIEKRRPENIRQHIDAISSDIQKIFNSKDAGNLAKTQNTIPTEFELSQNFPNPFNPTTKIQFALPMDGKVQLVIYDILGREVVKLVNNEFRTAGRYVSEFNGSRLASGIYFYRISVDEGKAFNQVKKMVLLK